MLDFHLHVWPHGPGTPTPSYELLARYCEAAAARGIERIAITEHSHRFERIAREVLPHWQRGNDEALCAATARVLAIEGGADLDAYVDALVRARDRGLPLRIGIEVDYLQGASEAMAAVLDHYPFDFRLGSVHWLGAWLFDDYSTPLFANEWERRDVSAVWRSYIDHILALIESVTVDVLAHLDLVKVAGKRPPDIEAHEARLVEAITDGNIAVEVSTAGLRKPAAEPYPSPSLLRQLVAAGVPLTTASDAHQIERIGDGFEALRHNLTSLGVTSLADFDQRQRIPHPL